MSVFRIFIVEDDPWYGELIKYHLSKNPDYAVHLFQSGRDCLDNMHLRPQVACIDFNLPDLRGDQLLTKLRAQWPGLPVVVISAQESISVVLDLLKKGAAEYIMKDENAKDLLWNCMVRLRENHELKKEVETLKSQLEQKFSFEKSIIGQSAAMRKTFSAIEKAVSSTINVSISGETGTGKEVIARAIHFSSERAKKPFVTVNMAAIPHELMESEIFGHEKGAFTGAVARRIGKFEEACGGTIFLDEIAELDLSLQAKLLRVLQEREVVRVGGNEPVKLDFRLITATHKDLPELVRKGLFREDLFYRVLGLPVTLPPLRERGNDILVLAKHFIDEFAVANKCKPLSLSAEAKEKLMKYNYPGNVRELRAVIELASVMCDRNEIRAADITFTIIKGPEDFTAVEKTMHDYTWDIIQFYLKKYNNNVLLVAGKLDIGKSTIYNLMKRYDKSISN